MQAFYPALAYLHLATVAPCFLIGAWLLAQPKGTKPHRLLGRIYALLILFTALMTLLMPAEVGPRMLGHFGFIHLFSVLVLTCIPLAIRGVRRGDLRAHRHNMLGVYIGGVLIAGAFTLTPGRMLHQWLFG